MKQLPLFPALCLTNVWPEHLMHRAANYVEKLWLEDAVGAFYSNRGGCWHSDNDDFLKNLPDINLAFSAMFMELATETGYEVKKLHLGAWAMVYLPNLSSYSAEHDHKDHDFAGVLYVKGNKIGDGQLFFKDPYGRRPDTHIPLKPGKMVVFPGHIRHYVTEHVGAHERVTISCNCRVDTGDGSETDNPFEPATVPPSNPG